MKKTLKELKKGVAKCEISLRRLGVGTKKDGTLRKNEKRGRLTKQKEQLKEEIKTTEQALKQCPQRISDSIQHRYSYAEL